MLQEPRLPSSVSFSGNSDKTAISDTSLPKVPSVTTLSAHVTGQLTPVAETLTTNHSLIERDINEAMLRIHYQPIVDLESGTIFAHEALGRTASSHFNGPLQMFDAALAAQCVGALGRALRQIAVQHSPPIPLFVNVHPVEFDEGWLVRPDEAIFWHSEAVYLEITESMPLSHFALCQSVLRELRGKGVFLAVDDLGAGYSNLKYIADLAPDVVKLDRELITGLSRDTRQFRLVKHLVRLCTDMGAQVVAEGIETVDELHAVIDAGAHLGQGYVLARPAFPAPTPQFPIRPPL